ncbi:hypothetical protein Tco_0255334 [Tanacetum coccineum]
MTTLAEFMIISGADNRPPMLEKSMYDSWKSRMELYMENRENGIMILDSVQNGPLVWPTIVEENGTTSKKKYEELSVTEKLQADCDLKATNIVLQGLPPDVYAIINHHKVAKEIWDRVKLLMEGTKLSLKERGGNCDLLEINEIHIILDYELGKCGVHTCYEMICSISAKTQRSSIGNGSLVESKRVYYRLIPTVVGLQELQVFSTWMAFEGNTLRGDGVAGIKRHRRDLSGDGVKNLATTSGRG